MDGKEIKQETVVNDQSDQVEEVVETTAPVAEESDTELNREIISMMEHKMDLLQGEKKKYEDHYNNIKNKYIQLLADFDNFKKRTRKEIEDVRKYAAKSLLKDFLPVIDNLQRGILHSEQSQEFEALIEGVLLVQKQFLSALDKYQVIPFESEGNPFDPNRHEALQMMPNNELPDRTVVTEYEKGYMIGERLLRPAKVIVSQRTEPEVVTESVDEGSKVDIQA